MGPDSFTIWPPFFKLHARAVADWLGMTVQNWIGLLAFGIDICTGVGKLLEAALGSIPPELISAATSAMVSTITTTATLYAASMLTVQLSQLTVGGYFVALGTYSGIGILAISAARLLPDVWLSKAILFGIGFTLISLLITGFFADQFFARFFSPLLSQHIAGGDPANIAFKFLVNFVANYVMKSALGLTSVVFFLNPLMWPFALATFALGVLAIYLAKTR